LLLSFLDGEFSCPAWGKVEISLFQEKGNYVFENDMSNFPELDMDFLFFRNPDKFSFH